MTKPLWMRKKSLHQYGMPLLKNSFISLDMEQARTALDSDGATAKFHAIETPTSAEMNSLLHRISGRIARLLEREGYLERDSQEGSLLLDGFDDDVINELQGSSITYRIAVGSHRGKKVFTLNLKKAVEA